jgi:transcriptional regulator with XRE-family HTH domain
LTPLNDNSNKHNKKIIGSIIKLNRINQNISQKNLCKGICVPSYLSRIENGELIPSEDVISIIFSKLGLSFNNSEVFIEKGKKAFEEFFHNLNFNEYDFTNTLFEQIEAKEEEYIASPLIIDYYIAKLARYCSTSERNKFEDTKNLLYSAFDLLTSRQKFLYNFYVGIDIFNIFDNKTKGKEYIIRALDYNKNGHCYFWLSYAYTLENNPIKAYDCIKKALDLYVTEGNILSIMDSYSKIAEVYFMLDNYIDALDYLKKSINMAYKIGNKHNIEHLNTLIAWSYYRLNDYKTSLAYLNKNKGLLDHRMIIPDSVIKSLIYFTTKDKKCLQLSISELNNPASLNQINKELANAFYDFYSFYIENDDYLDNNICEHLLLNIIKNIHKSVELNKVFKSFLKDYYIHNRRYKDALYIS